MLSLDVWAAPGATASPFPPGNGATAAVADSASESSTEDELAEDADADVFPERASFAALTEPTGESAGGEPKDASTRLIWSSEELDELYRGLEAAAADDRDAKEDESESSRRFFHQYAKAKSPATARMTRMNPMTIPAMVPPVTERSLVFPGEAASRE